MTMAYISEIRRHVVKSFGAEHLEAARISPYGIEDDRKYMVVDAETGEFVSQKHRGMAKMATVRPGLANGALWLSMGETHVSVEEAEFERPGTAVLYGNEVPALWTYTETDLEAAVSDYLERHVRLVQGDGNREISERRHGEGFSHNAYFPDSSQLHIATLPSLDAVNRQRLDPHGTEPLRMETIRPNLVLAAAAGDLEPFEEERGRRLRVLGTETIDILINGPTIRCALTEINQQTGEKGTHALAILKQAGRQGKERSTGKKGLWLGIYGSPAEGTDAMIATGQTAQFVEYYDQSLVDLD